jgi:hypothetical protein
MAYLSSEPPSGGGGIQYAAAQLQEAEFVINL